MNLKQEEPELNLAERVFEEGLRAVKREVYGLACTQPAMPA
jgi:hypothetical protein